MLFGFRPFILLPLLVSSVLPVLAQDARGSIGGRVMDAQEALIVGARVTATNQQTGVAGSAASNESAPSSCPSCSPASTALPPR